MANIIKIGNLEIDSFKVGAADCSIYLGTTKLYPQGEPPTPPVFEGKYKLTLQDSSVVSAACGTSEITQAEVKAYSSTTVSLVIGQCVTSIGTNCFWYFTNLTAATIGDNVVTIRPNAFNSCSGLTSIDIPDSVTTIDYTAFSNCTSLQSVTIGAGITYIGSSAFYNCTGLTSFNCEATTPPQIGSEILRNTTCPIYVPAESVETYRTAWSDYASRIQAIP